MIKNYDSHENKISIYSNHAVHLGDQGRRKKQNKSVLTSSRQYKQTSHHHLLTCERNAKHFHIYKAMYTWALGHAIHTASEVVAEYRSLNAKKEKKRTVKNKNMEHQ